MSTPNTLQEVLERTSTLDLTMDVIADHMDATMSMYCLLRTSEDGGREPFAKEDAYGRSRPRFFTDFEAVEQFAHAQPEFAVTRCFETRSEPWLTGLLRFWEDGGKGLVLDAGGGVEIDLDRGNIRGLIMAFTVEWFVSPSDLCVVMHNGRVYYHENSAGEKLAFGFTTRATAFDNLSRMRSSVPNLVVAPVDPALLIEGTLGADVDRLILDPGMATERAFTAKNLQTLRELRLGTETEDRVAATAESFFAQAEGTVDLASVISGREEQESLDVSPSPEPDSMPTFEVEPEVDAGTESVVQSQNEPVAAEAFEGLDELQLELTEQVAAAPVEASTPEPVGAEPPVADDEELLSAIVPSEAEIEAVETPADRAGESPSAGFRPRRPAKAAHERLLEIKALSDSDARQSWMVAENLAHDLDLWVPFTPDPSTGRAWPYAEPAIGPNGREVNRAQVFTSEEEGRSSLARTNSPLDLYPLAGIDAFRWIWSAPHHIAEILIDPFGEGGGIQLQRNTIPAMLFPVLLGVRDLSLVPDTPLGELAKLPFAHGLKPEVILAMAKNWTTLLGPPADGSQGPVAFAHGNFVPVFSSAERFHHFVKGANLTLATPVPSPETPPFMQWLRLAGRSHGVILDPRSVKSRPGEALTLEAVELFHLQLWAEEMAAPDGTRVANALFALQHGDYGAEQSVCGQIAADWPVYLAAVVRNGDKSRLLGVPGSNDLALFSGERELAEFKHSYKSQDPVVESAEPHHMLPRWRSNFFSIANDKFSGLCINPGASGTPHGVRLDGKGLDGAISRLDARLCPRVRGFPDVS